jgi:integral membrane sensor domain MASE1
LVTARPTPWDRIIIVGCPFVVVAAGAHLTKSIGTMLAEAWPPQ